MTAGMVAVPAIVPLKAPGNSFTGTRKWLIDSNTLIEIHTSSKDCLLFYTLNGTKPDPFKKIGDKTTYQYIQAFTLKPGKRTIKAIAVLKDGSKESSVNTKVFQVDLAEEKSDDEREENLNTTWESQANTDDKLQKYNSAMFKKVIRHTEEKDPIKTKEAVRKVLTGSPEKNYVFSVKEKATNPDDVLRCIHCNEMRPSDPYARFCNGCGASVPPAPGRLRSPVPPNNDNSILCNNCGSVVPGNSACCCVCDIKLRSSQQNNKSISRSKCFNCGTKNPTSAVECMVCDESLTITVTTHRKIAPGPSKDFAACPFCKRVNSSDARFCDWCGEKPQVATATITCHRCSAENSLHSEYCCSCGKVLHPPMRKHFKETLEQGDFTIKDHNGPTMEFLATLTDGNNPTWKDIPLHPSNRRRSKNIAVQVGDGSLTKGINGLSLGSGKVGPGKGYWRQQVDHVSHHLKIYTQNNIEFRESFSRQLISGLISAEIEESDDNLEVKLITTFAVRNGDFKKSIKKSLKSPDSGQTLINALSSTSKSKISRPGSASSRPGSGRCRPSSAQSRPDSARSRLGSARKKKKISQKDIEKEKIAAKLSKLSEDNLRLLNMIKSSKEVDPDKVQELLDLEDIDPNTVDENDIPLLKLCVVNKHFDSLQLLITAGATIDKTSGVKETSALHEAVILGVTGRDAVDILLENGASPDVKDKKGKSPYDMALDSGIDLLISKFKKHTTNDLLKDILKI